MEPYIGLIKKHDDGTMFCSFAHHMRSASPTYTEIISEGEKIVPTILSYLRDNNSGMSVMMLLEDILQTSPYVPPPAQNDKGDIIEGVVAFRVPEARQSWLEWGIKNNLI